ncbi:carbonic anhydrase-like [Anopheles bellator]|uniref:carbonic anhydrase-like n=1 Tax=Anopheles bellator TaxID=139047 RepID=UPI002649D33C|nr:carbonic anhydrase-like [Anopheles bellator]
MSKHLVSGVTCSVLLLLAHCFLVINADFSYDDPDRWAETDPECAGSRQSPIDIVRAATVAAPEQDYPLKLQGFFRQPVTITVENNGHTAQYTFGWSKDSNRPTIRGGPLGSSIYAFEQLHFHWGAEDDRGSEHTFDGQALPLEGHFVFFNRDYGTFEKAVEQPDGLSVMGVLFELRPNLAEAKWARPLGKVRQAGSSATLTGKDVFSLNDVAGSDWDRYYAYPGSLTTPPCAESVTWIVRSEPFPVAPKDLRALRNLLDSNGAPLVDNFRPVQPLNDRTVTRYGF